MNTWLGTEVSDHKSFYIINTFNINPIKNETLQMTNTKKHKEELIKLDDVKHKADSQITVLEDQFDDVYNKICQVSSDSF